MFALLMGSTNSKSERTRQFISALIAPVFNKKGYAGTALTDVTNATGLTKGSIYGSFENKDEVALAAFDYNFNRVTLYIRERILATAHAIERLMVYPKVCRNSLKIPFLKPGCPTLNTSTEAGDTYPELRKRAVNALAFWKTSIENQVKSGIRRQEIKADTDPAIIAVIVMSIIEGAVIQAMVTAKSTERSIAMTYLENDSGISTVKIFN